MASVTVLFAVRVGEGPSSQQVAGAGGKKVHDTGQSFSQLKGSQDGVASGAMAVPLNDDFNTSVFRNYFKVTNTDIQRGLIHHSQGLDTT